MAWHGGDGKVAADGRGASRPPFPSTASYRAQSGPGYQVQDAQTGAMLVTPNVRLGRDLHWMTWTTWMLDG